MIELHFTQTHPTMISHLSDMPIKLVYVHMELAGLVHRPLLENQEGI